MCISTRITTRDGYQLLLPSYNITYVCIINLYSLSPFQFLKIPTPRSCTSFLVRFRKLTNGFSPALIIILLYDRSMQLLVISSYIDSLYIARIILIITYSFLLDSVDISRLYSILYTVRYSVIYTFVCVGM